jgi:hypothetical protein
MPLLGLAGLRELIRRRRRRPAGRPAAAAAAVRPFYSTVDWLEGLASWPAIDLLTTVPSLSAGSLRRTACLPLLFSCDPRFLFCWGRHAGPVRSDTLIIIVRRSFLAFLLENVLWYSKI